MKGTGMTMPTRGKTKGPTTPTDAQTVTAYRVADLGTGLFFVKSLRLVDTPETLKKYPWSFEPTWEFGGGGETLFSSPDEAAASLRAVSSKISPLWCIQEITISVASSFSIPPP